MGHNVFPRTVQTYRDFLHFTPASTLYKTFSALIQTQPVQEKYIILVQQQDTVQLVKGLAGGADEVEEVRDSWLTLGRVVPSFKRCRRLKDNIRTQRSAIHTTTVWQI